MKRFIALTATLALLVTVGIAAQSAQKPAAKPSALLASLQGTWQMTVINGQDVAGSGQEPIITIKDMSYTNTVGGQVVERGTFKFDDTKKPHTLDITITEGDDAGKVQLGVFEVTGNTMRGKLAEPGTTTRPTDFALADGFFVFTMVKK